MLGLFYEIYRDRHGSRKKAWEVLEPRLKKLYPKDFDWVYFTAEGETLVERWVEINQGVISSMACGA